MTTKVKILVLVSIFIFSFGSTTTVPQTHIITLNVDTYAIENSNVDEVSNFGQPQGVSNRDYTINVKKGDIVLWKGVSSSAPETDQVLISAINHEGGARVFGRNTLLDSPQNPGIVVGTVTEGKDGEEEKYKLSFKVMNDSIPRGGTYHIDPKIRVTN